MRALAGTRLPTASHWAIFSTAATTVAAAVRLDAVAPVHANLDRVAPVQANLDGMAPVRITTTGRVSSPMS